MKNRWKVLLVVLIVVCFGVAASYPIRYWMEDKSTEENMDRLLAMRDAGLASRRNHGEDGETEGRPEQEQEPDDAQEGSEEAEEATEAPGAADTDGAKVGETAAESGDVDGNERAQQGTQDSQGSQNSQGSQGGQNNQSSQDKTSPSDQAIGGQSTGPQASEPQEPGTQPTEVPKKNFSEDSSEDSTKAPTPAQTAQAFGAVTDGAWPIIDYSVLYTSTEVPSGPTVMPTPTPEPTATPVPTPSPTPGPTVNRFERDEALPYEWKEKKTLDVDAILPQYKEIYEENNDFVGWITIPGTIIDYPVVQCEDSDYYLKHDFFGNKNANGQIILDTKCDPYTPSYNLVISGHSMKSGKMFGNLVNYMYESYWRKHKIVYFDTLMEQKTYVVYAAFFSANYDVDEEGFRYNADIGYSLDARQWLREISENELYDTGVDAEFGDEFLTLTTCNHVYHKNGRFVVICRRLREGEEIE